MKNTHSKPAVLVEGLDLAGKTTACRQLVAHYKPRPEHRRNALTLGNEIYDVADEMRRGRALGGAYLGHLYVAAMALDLQRHSAPARMTIQESTVGLRSFCHYQARGESDLAQAFARLLDDDKHPRFSCCIVLTASLEARRQRLQQRQREEPDQVADDDLAVLVAPETFLQMDFILIHEAKRRYGARVIDTSDLSSAEVVARMIRIIDDTIGEEAFYPVMA